MAHEGVLFVFELQPPSDEASIHCLWTGPTAFFRANSHCLEPRFPQVISGSKRFILQPGAVAQVIFVVYFKTRSSVLELVGKLG